MNKIGEVNVDLEGDGEFDQEEWTNESSKNTQALKDFLIGEEEVDNNQNGLLCLFVCVKRLLMRMWRLIQIPLGIYHPVVVLPEGGRFNDKASEMLVQACTYRYVNIYNIVSLLENGADPNAESNRFGNSCLHILCKRGHYLGILYLLRANADVNKVNNLHQTPLMFVCDTKIVDFLKAVYLLLSQPNIKLEVRDAGGNSALMGAIFKNNVWITRALLLSGCLVTDAEPGKPCAYEIAVYVLATGLLCDVDQLPLSIVNPTNFWYMNFSLKGYYESGILGMIAVLWQSIFNYNAMLIFRMVQRKRKWEERHGVKIVKSIVKPFKQQTDIEAQLQREQEEIRLRNSAQVDIKNKKVQTIGATLSFLLTLVRCIQLT